MSAGEFTARAVVLRLYAYDFYKKVNSTKRIGTAGVSNNIDYAYTHGHWTQGGEGHFSGGTSYYKPTIDWDMGKRYSGDNAYTYDSSEDGNAAAVIFPRYLVALTETTNGGLDYRRPLFYFVDDGEMLNGHIMRLYCTMDVLATFKDDLLRCSAFVLRSSSGYDANLIDSMVVPNCKGVNTTIGAASSIPGINYTSDDVVMRTVGKSGADNYVVGGVALGNIFSRGYDDSQWDWVHAGITDTLKYLFYGMTNIAQFVQSVKWFPFSVPTSSSKPMSFGYFETEFDVPVADDYNTFFVSVDMPAKYYNDWRDYDSRFTQLHLHLPCIGVIPIDPKLRDFSLVANYGVDINTGACYVLLKAQNLVIGTYSGQMGVDIPVGGISSQNGLVSVASGIGALATGNIAAGAAAAGGALQSVLSPPQNTLGASGNKAVWFMSNSTRQAYVTQVSMGTSGSPRTSEGSPCYQWKQLSTLTGFVKCASGTFMESLDTDATPLAPDTIMCKEIKDAINAFMVNGFYIEDDNVFQFDQQTKTR